MTSATVEERNQLLRTLERRFEENMPRHEGLRWTDVAARLNEHPSALPALAAMENSGGEPDVVGQDAETGAIVFCDCSAESPKGRRSLCYDGRALASRREHKPRGSVTEMAADMGIELLTEDEYVELQRFGPFDTKTSSWVVTPADLRDRGGALFGDWRYGRVFIYHNGAESYYAARGFRGKLRV
jgi:hypothetical protein